MNTTTTPATGATFRTFYTVPETHAERVQAVYINTDGNEKLGKHVWSFSTMPGNAPIVLKSGEIVSNIVGTCSNCRACFGGDHPGACYAESSCRRYPNTAAAYTRNTAILYEDPTAIYTAYRDALQKRRDSKRAKMPELVRINESGEFTPAVFDIFYQLALDFPEVIFFAYSKNTELIHDARDRMQQDGEQWPANLIVRASQWRDAAGVETVPNPDDLPTFHYDDGTHADIKSMVHCRAVNEDGTKTGVTCEECKLCISRIHDLAVYAH